MKKGLFFFVFSLLTTALAWSQTVTITEQGGTMEAAYVKWTATGATEFNVYYTGGGLTNQKIDNQLVRAYSNTPGGTTVNYFRADVLGIASGSYTLKVVPVVSGSEVSANAVTTSAINVMAHDRNGFAFAGARYPGGYSANGTPKSGAVILYITENTKNTITFSVITSSKGATTSYTGFQNILYGIKKGYDTRPYIFRVIGTITDMTVMEGGDIVIENANNASSYVTLEGVGDDATINGMGVRLKNASNIEVSNLGVVNCNSSEGDNIGMQQGNDHIWIHNNDLFYGNAGSDADQVKGDGALDNKNSTFCTFSYNHFWDNGKASLLGLSEGSTTGLYVTYHHNWFDHSDSRHPRTRYYSAHVYNNYFDGNAKYGIGSTLGSSIFAECNYFRDAYRPMMISLQGTDIKDGVANGTFSGEAGGIIKAYNNIMDADNGANTLSFIPWAATGAANTSFDAYVVTDRATLVPTDGTVVSLSGGNKYNNFDNDATLYVKNLVPDEPAAAKANVIAHAGRVNGGDLKYTFDNSKDDYGLVGYSVIDALKAAVTNYKTCLVTIQGEGAAPVVNTQTLTLTSGVASQVVASGDAITTIVYTWGGDATDATVTGIPASGVLFAKNSTAKTITITGNPTAAVSYSIVTSGSAGTPVTATGTITISSEQILSSPSNANQSVLTGSAIASIVYTWGGVATGATVTGLPASGLVYATDAAAKTITITGTPTANVSYSITTTGASGTPVTRSGAITVTTSVTTGDEIHNFTLQDKTSTFYSITGNLSTSYGTASYAGLTLTQCLKMESSTNITFTSTAAGTLTLVFGSSYTGSVKVDGTSYTPTAGIVTVKIAAGAHTIIKNSGSNYLFYMSVVYDAGTSTVIENADVVDVNLYPNPVVNSLSVETSLDVAKIEVYSVAGILVASENNAKTIDMSNLSNGSYFVKVYTAQGASNKMILKK